jgi:hypothetical protein
MLKMENFDKVWGFVHAVIDQNRGMHQLAHPRTLFNQATDIRETFEKLHMVQDGVAKPFGAGGKVGPRIGEDENLLTRLW